MGGFPGGRADEAGSVFQVDCGCFSGAMKLHAASSSCCECSRAFFCVKGKIQPLRDIRSTKTSRGIGKLLWHSGAQRRPQGLSLQPSLGSSAADMTCSCYPPGCSEEGLWYTQDCCCHCWGLQGHSNSGKHFTPCCCCQRLRSVGCTCPSQSTQCWAQSTESCSSSSIPAGAAAIPAPYGVQWLPQPHLWPLPHSPINPSLR